MFDYSSFSILIDLSNIVGVMIVMSWLMSVAIRSKPCRKCDL